MIRVRPGADRGSAMVWVLMCVLVVVAGAVVLALLGTAALARHRAAAAADAAALAAAARLLEPAPVACSAARRLAAANGAAVVRCVVRTGAVTVTTRLDPRGWLGRFGAATGVARAGQIPANPPEGRQPKRRRNLAWSSSLTRVTTPPG